ncbi:MAG TPA: hypothetical protein VI298_05290 [Geobacteraceae bacterium]
MKMLKAVTLAICLGIMAACGGGGSGGGSVSTTSNVAPVYTLKVSGGTLNDGSGTNGLAVLATLRDSQGTGPGLTGGWRITITGPGITQPLTVPYDDGAPASYEIWRWEGLNPATGTYTATASNGTATLISTFTIDAASTIPQPPLTKNGSAVSWTPVPGAGSYHYTVTDGTGSAVASGYINADSAAASYSFPLPTLADGSYAVQVLAHTASIPLLMGDTSPSPSLPSRENISASSMTFAVAGGVDGSYDMAAKGGTLYMGKDSSQTDQYGLVIWSSILTSTGTPPAGDWTVTVTGPGITTPLTFTYPATDSHYAYWDFGTVPAAGTYTVTATASGSADSVSAQFSIPAPTAQLPVETGISVTPGSNSYAVNWNAVPGAGSYYVNIWANVGGEYTEVATAWVDGNTYTAVIPKNSLTKGALYDVYVTACTLDMTTAHTVPPPGPSQVNMSDNTFAPASFTAQ